MNLPNTLADPEYLVHAQGNDGGLYIATEVGVYFTNNKRIAAFDPLIPEDADDLTNSSGWVRLGGALPHVTSIGLEVNCQINRIRIGTTGRGVWEHGLHCPTNIDLTENGTYSTGTFLEAQVSITSDAIVPSAIKVDYRGGTEVHLTAGFHATNGARFHAFLHPCDMPGNSFQPKIMHLSEGVAQDNSDVDYVAGPLLLFPNPARETVSVLCTSLTEKSNAQIRFFDTTGRQALARNMRGKLNVLDVSSFTGLFTVVVDTDAASFVERIVIE